jgi:hypothetical protein
MLKLLAHDMTENRPKDRDRNLPDHKYTKITGSWLTGRQRVPAYDGSWFSGCPSLELLDAYFGPWLDDLGSRFGYSVYSYTVPDKDFVHHPDTVECIARLDNARLVSTQNCATYSQRRHLEENEMVLTTQGSTESGDPNRSQGKPDSKTQGLLDKIGTPTKAVKAGKGSGRKR